MGIQKNSYGFLFGFTFHFARINADCRVIKILDELLVFHIYGVKIQFRNQELLYPLSNCIYEKCLITLLFDCMCVYHRTLCHLKNQLKKRKNANTTAN